MNFIFMHTLINTKQLRAELPKIVEETRKGASFTVLYRSRPAFDIVPPHEPQLAVCALENDPLYQAEAVGRSGKTGAAINHDKWLYPHK